MASTRRSDNAPMKTNQRARRRSGSTQTKTGQQAGGRSSNPPMETAEVETNQETRRHFNLNTRVPRELFERVAAAAALEQVSTSELNRRALQEYLDTYETRRRPDLEELTRKAVKRQKELWARVSGVPETG